MFSEAERWTPESPMELPGFADRLAPWVSGGFVGAMGCSAAGDFPSA